MATAATVALTPSTHGVLHVPEISQDSCTRASQLLQKNHDDYHMYFNTSGFHNHIAHHLLTIFALGATPSQIQSAFDTNAPTQRPQFPVTKENVQSMKDSTQFSKFLGNEKYFHDYEIFFRKEIEAANGDWQSVLHTQLFGPSPQARDLLTRMYAGFYHPIIHLGFGIEFSQPAIIVEALAQAATHDNWPTKFITATDDLASKRLANNEKSRPLFDLINEARATDKIREAPHWEDGNKVRDGILVRAPTETAELCSQWLVKPEHDDLRLKTAEMINVAAYFAGATQHASRKKAIKFDFFYMHCVNASIFYSAFMRPENDWLGNETRAKLLMWKGWNDIALYVSRGSPLLIKEEITEYKPKNPGDNWPELFKRVDDLMDDGHASKLLRALANGEQTCKEFEDGDGKDWPVKGDMWLKLGHMAIDSVEGAGTRWARNVGWDQAWEGIPERDGTRKEGLKVDAHDTGIQQGYHETV
ncbi:hypothetical protein H2198_001830 [Neophaeococcomyces mojaviensis]|uniref:Uncharacterized protein n=1 Tax=Neophaeococcomyces mojaviensis TaxID=3383035 RepID=A0ACC3AFV4_9EURO|nr:hypothetical protein H2198_001830 [Knufia sp. JES_112]